MAENRFTFYNVGNGQGILLPLWNQTSTPLDSRLVMRLTEDAI